MITSRYITPEDLPLLSDSLSKDGYHADTPANFFTEDGTVCLVYQDEAGPICFVRGMPLESNGVAIIQLDIQYLDNKDFRRNLKAMLVGFPELERRAKENGFSGFFVVSNVPLLRNFCIKRLGFQEYGDEFLVKSLIDNRQTNSLEVDKQHEDVV